MKSEDKTVTINNYMLDLFSTTTPNLFNFNIIKNNHIKRIIYLQELSYSLENTNLLKGLIKISEKNNERKIIIGKMISSNNIEYSQIEINELPNYEKLIYPHEHILLSESGQWGVIYTIDEVGILVIKSKDDYLLLQTIEPEIENHLSRFLSILEKNVESIFERYGNKGETWWIPLLNSIYGEKITKALIKDSILDVYS